MSPFLFFSVFVAVVLFGGHFFLWFSLLRFFSIDQAWIKFSLSAFMILMSLAFMPTVSWVEAIPGSFGRYLHVFTSYWVGFLGNLLIFISLTWIIYLLLRFFKINVEIKILAGIMLSFSLLLSIAGLISAANPLVKEVNIKIANLPEAWKGKKIVQLSDVHFGAINNIAFLSKIVQTTNALNPDLVVFTGDLFDREDGVGQDFISTISQIKAKNGSYFVFGNHDVYYGMDNVTRVLAAANIKILRDEMVNISGLQLIGLDGWEFTGRTDINQILTKINFTKNSASVLLYHVPANVPEIKASGINLWLAGHTHRGQLWPINWLISWVYKGYGYGLFQDNNFSLYVSPGVGSWGPPMRTSGRPEIVVINLE